MSEPVVLVVSCDKYSDLWSPFFQLFRKHWPDCPYEVFLGTNYLSFDSNGVTSIPIGQDRSWAENLRFMLDAVDSSRIIMFLEDFLMIDGADTPKIRRLVELAGRHKVGCLRLFPHPTPTGRLAGFGDIGMIQPGDEWRVSTQTAIWDKKLLYSLAKPGFSAWQFEIIGSLLSDTLPDLFWSVYEPAVNYCNGVVLGKWVPQGLEACGKAGVKVDLESRGTITEDELLLRSRQRKTGFTKVMASIMPHSMERRIMRWLRLLRRDFYLARLLSEAGLQITDAPK